MSSRRRDSSVKVIAFDSEDLPESLARIAPAEVIARWVRTDRSSRAPEVVAVSGAIEGEWVGAALVTARAGCAYLKIVDVCGDERAVLDAVVELALSRGLVQLKWEGWTITEVVAAECGFTPLHAPRGHVDGGPDTGYVRWLVDVDITPRPYYRQTEDFTCGAVVALMAQNNAGIESEDGLDRAAELALWRTATNFPACEPVGLGVAVRRRWPEASVQISLDVDRAIMIDHLSESEQEWRAALQQISRTDAADLGIPVDGGRASIADIRGAIDGGEQVLLLISLSVMQGFAVPHWVHCHAVLPGVIVVDDPWAGVATGDTWVDAHLLPVTDALLDEMSALENDGYRGVIRIAS